MACDETLGRLDAYLDGELEPNATAELERHLAECTACRDELTEGRALSDMVRAHATRFKAPDGLADSISTRLRSDAGSAPRRRFSGITRLALAASIVLAVALAALVSRDISRPQDGGLATQEVADAHRRSLSTGHWTEFASSDPRALVSWARDRGVDNLLTIADLRSEGYSLLGGRREFVDGRVALAIVYRREGKIVELFVAPAPSAAVTHARLRSIGNVNVVDWTEPGLAFWAVSRIDGKALRSFHKSVESTTRVN